MFERLFKFDPIQYGAGEIALETPGLVALLLLGALAGLLLLVYLRADRFPTRRGQWLSFGLRGGALVLLALPLFQPVLVTPDVVPDENFVAVLVDGSASMGIADGEDGATRGETLRRVLLDQGLAEGLEEHFVVRYYTFGETARRTDSTGAFETSAPSTDLTSSLRRTLDDFRGMPLAGVVLLTDGADNSGGVPLNAAEDMRRRDVPLHVVGVGDETVDTDRELLEVSVADGIEETTGAEIDVKVRSWGAEPEPVAFNLYRGDEVVYTEARTLKGEGKIDQFTLFYEPEAPGAFEYRLEVESASGERNTRNNVVHALIDTKRDTIRVLFLEGHLRQEFKFAKRVLEDDAVVDFVSISRTNTGTFYRQGIRSGEELTGGFAADAEELFDFRVLLLGDIEASSFTLEQLRLMEQFVRVRGGGLVMLGGRSALAEGDYASTPVADVLPVQLDPGRAQPIPRRFDVPEREPVEQGFRFAPTSAGLESPILRLSAEPAVNRSRWAEMPGLTSLNLLGAVKPGGVVLAVKPEDDFGAEEPLLVVQRYGKGRAGVLATASTWRWRMLMEADDARHARFWRQLVRWHAAGAPGRVQLDLAQTRFAPGREVELPARVYDPAYAPVEGARVEGVLRDPAGLERPLRFEEDLAEAGLYAARVVPEEEGLYEIEVRAGAAEGAIGSYRKTFLVRAPNVEYYDATLKRGRLELLAQTAGGAYYDAGEAGDIPIALRSRRTSTSVFHAEPLWDMPFLFVLALALLSAEWFYRRRKGLP